MAAARGVRSSQSAMATHREPQQGQLPGSEHQEQQQAETHQEQLQGWFPYWLRPRLEEHPLKRCRQRILAGPPSDLQYTSGTCPARLGLSEQTAPVCP